MSTSLCLDIGKTRTFRDKPGEHVLRKGNVALPTKKTESRNFSTLGVADVIKKRQTIMRDQGI